jgi:hypothetical protein
LGEQGQGVGGVREDVQGGGAAGAQVAGVAAEGEDLGESVEDGGEVDDLAGGGAGDDGFQAVFAGLGGPHALAGLGFEAAGLGGVGVGVDDEAFEVFEVGAPGQGGDLLVGVLVDPVGLVAGQGEVVAADQTGGLQRFPAADLSAQHAEPQLGVAVAQVGDLAQQAAPGERVHLEQRGELRAGELADRRGAVGAGCHDPLLPGTGPAPTTGAASTGVGAGVGLLGGGVHVQPAGGQHQLPGLGIDQVALGLDQRRAHPGRVFGQVARVEVGAVLIHSEHATRPHRQFSNVMDRIEWRVTRRVLRSHDELRSRVVAELVCLGATA